MYVRQHHLDGLGCMSYLVGDEASGEGLVIDPQLTIQEYVDAAGEAGLEIRHVLDTHLHADHVSGGRALARATGATLWLPEDAGARYDHEPLTPRTRIRLGSVSLAARKTPGHTPEHVTFELYDDARDPNVPYALFTGDTLFVGGVGRPDLVAAMPAEDLAGQLHETVTRTLAGLDGASLVYPGHGAGSACGASIGRQLHTTLGYERRTNPYFRVAGKGEFVAKVTTDLPGKPGNAASIKRINTRGPPEALPPPQDVPALSPDAFEAKVRDPRRVLVLDAGEPDAFAANHVPGSVNVTLAAAPFPNRVATFLEWDLPVYLVLPDDADLERALVGLARVGGFDVKGFLEGGIHAWRNDGKPIATMPTRDVRDAHADEEGAILDVRARTEWDEGHAPRAHLAPWEELARDARGLDRTQAWNVVCGSGYRSSMAASLLQREGHRVSNVLGGMTAWRKAGLPLETPQAPRARKEA